MKIRRLPETYDCWAQVEHGKVIVGIRGRGEGAEDVTQFATLTLDQAYALRRQMGHAIRQLTHEQKGTP